MNSTQTLILGAFEGELAPMREILGDQRNIQIHEIGVGLVQAAVNASSLLNSLKSQLQRDEYIQVMFVGSAGSCDTELPLLSLITSPVVTLGDAAVADERGFFPPPVPQAMNADEDLLALFRNLTPTVKYRSCYSVTAITRDETLGQSLCDKTGATVENLELFSVASACAKFDIPWCNLTALTNYVGPNGHKEWLANHREAAGRTAEAVYSFYQRRPS